MKGLDSIWICDKCHVSFTDEAECAEHEGFCKRADVILNNRWTCKDCGYKSPISVTVAEHKSFCQGRPESEPDGNSYFCIICGRYHPDSHQCLPKPTHTVELTEEDVIKLEFIISKFKFQNDDIKSIYDDLLAKLRPKKENVEVEIDGLGILITKDAIYFLDKSSPKLRYLNQYMGLPHKDFELIIAAYHDHVDEVK